MKKYRVTLTNSEVDFLEEISRKGKRSTQVISCSIAMKRIMEGNRKTKTFQNHWGVTVRTMKVSGKDLF